MENQTSPDLVMVIENACFVDSLIWMNWTVLPICVHYCTECGVVNKICRRDPISFKHVSLWCFLFDPHLNTHKSNIGV
jgi:hypothetical protein